MTQIPEYTHEELADMFEGSFHKGDGAYFKDMPFTNGKLIIKKRAGVRLTTQSINDARNWENLTSRWNVDEVEIFINDNCVIRFYGEAAKAIHKVRFQMHLNGWRTSFTKLSEVVAE